MSLDDRKLFHSRSSSYEQDRDVEAQVNEVNILGKEVHKVVAFIVTDRVDTNKAISQKKEQLICSGKITVFLLSCINRRK